jgi:hypothetical protein
MKIKVNKDYNLPNYAISTLNISKTFVSVSLKLLNSVTTLFWKFFKVYKPKVTIFLKPVHLNY